MTDSQRFEGFDKPRYTPTPDALFDVLLPDLSLVELRVLLYIIRRTFGFKKDSDTISVAQMESGIVTRDGRRLDRGTGLSTAGVRKGIRGLLDRGVIVALQNTDETGASLPTTYALRFKDEGTQPSQERVHTRTPSLDTPVHHSPAQVNTHNKQLQDTEEQEVRIRISRFIEDFAREMRDRAPLQSSVSRAFNIYTQSGLELEDFTALMYEARAKTKATANVKNRFAYFMTVLEDLSSNSS